MAISVFFRLATQNETQVEYAFGTSPDEADRRLLVNALTMQASPADGREDYQFLTAARRISVLLGQQGSWPETGGMHS